jgi:hypothetical protein
MTWWRAARTSMAGPSTRGGAAMRHWLDDIARGLATPGVSRRAALRRLGAGVVAGALTTLGRQGAVQAVDRPGGALEAGVLPQQACPPGIHPAASPAVARARAISASTASAARVTRSAAAASARRAARPANSAASALVAAPASAAAGAAAGHLPAGGYRGRRRPGVPAVRARCRRARELGRGGPQAAAARRRRVAEVSQPRLG